MANNMIVEPTFDSHIEGGLYCLTDWANFFAIEQYDDLRSTFHLLECKIVPRLTEIIKEILSVAYT